MCHFEGSNLYAFDWWVTSSALGEALGEGYGVVPPADLWIVLLQPIQSQIDVHLSEVQYDELNLFTMGANHQPQGDSFSNQPGIGFSSITKEGLQGNFQVVGREFVSFNKSTIDRRIGTFTIQKGEGFVGPSVIQRLN